VGITTAIASQTGANNGIAFAVPIDLARSIVDQLRMTGKVSRGQLGVAVSELTEELAKSFGFQGKGILVQDVKPDSAAATAGIVAGDVIVTLDGKPVDDIGHFRNSIARSAPGEDVQLGVWRNGKMRSVTVTLGAQEVQGAEPTAPVEEKPPLLGLALTDANPQQRARLGGDVIVEGVEPGSPAAKAGIAPGDVLESIGDEPVDDARAAARELRERAKDGVRLRLRRGDEGRFVYLRAPTS
jgi:serine protease Do